MAIREDVVASAVSRPSCPAIEILMAHRSHVRKGKFEDETEKY